MAWENEHDQNMMMASNSDLQDLQMRAPDVYRYTDYRINYIT